MKPVFQTKENHLSDVKMKDWQEEILEREGFNKTDKMKNTMEINWKDGTTTKEVDGKIVTVKTQAQEINANLRSIIG